MIPKTDLNILNELIDLSRKHDAALRLHVEKINKLVEDFDNINRMNPVKLGRPAGSNKKSSTNNNSIASRVDYVSIPTKAEMEYYQSGLRLPDKPENLQKLIDDMSRTGRFDYELCYLLRKQEAQEKLKDWVKDVQKKRMNGESDFGKDVDSNRFSDLFESTIKNFKVLTFKEAFMESLRKDCET